MSKYKLVPQPENSFNDNPCLDCVFGKEEGICTAPREIIYNEDDGEECGFKWKGQQYVYVEVEDTES